MAWDQLAYAIHIARVQRDSRLSDARATTTEGTTMQSSRRGRKTTRTTAILLTTGLALTALAGCGAADSPKAGTSSSSGNQSGATNGTDRGQNGEPAPIIDLSEVTPPKVSPKVKRQARESVADYVATADDALASPERAARAANGSMVRKGPAWQATMNLAREYAENGWTVTGETRVVEYTVVEQTENPPTLTVAACLDTSGLKVTDEHGKTVGLQGNRSDRTMQVLTLVRQDGRWAVQNQGYATDPSC